MTPCFALGETPPPDVPPVTHAQKPLFFRSFTMQNPFSRRFPAPAALLGGLLLSLAGCTTGAPLPPPAPTPAPGVWQTLFDGRNMDAWRGYCQEGMPAKGWKIEGDTLHILRDAGCGDLITKAQYGDFVLELEYKTAPGINSGILYRTAEVRGQESWQSAFECQILDPAWRDDRPGHVGEKMDLLHHAGSLYGIYPTKEAALKPAGQWNKLSIAVTGGNHIEHWLNGIRVVSCDLDSLDYAARLKKSKFSDPKEFPQFGKNHFGYIGIQDHGDTELWLRNIRVMPLDRPAFLKIPVLMELGK